MKLRVAWKGVGQNAHPSHGTSLEPAPNMTMHHGNVGLPSDAMFIKFSIQTNPYQQYQPSEQQLDTTNDGAGVETLRMENMNCSGV